MNKYIPANLAEYWHVFKYIQKYSQVFRSIQSTVKVAHIFFYNFTIVKI